MYYYEKYDVFVLITALVLLISLFLFTFRHRISTLIDPLCFHLLWCASVLSLLAGYIYKYGLNPSSILFILTFTIYLSTLYIVTRIPTENAVRKTPLQHKVVTMYFVCLVLFMASRYEFIIYALKANSPVEWFLYKFKQIEGRSPVQYILQLGARPFFLYYTFVLIATRHNLKRFGYFMLVVNIVMDIIAGGRSSLIGVIMMFGYYVYLFPELFPVRKLRQINVWGLVGIFFALMILAIVTSFYSQEISIKDGYLAMLNRLLAAGDGLDLYLVNNAEQHIPSGLGEYIKSVFGIFIKRVVPIQTQSVGWQLYELDQGRIIPFSVGPNFILPLQVAVLGYTWLIPYCVFIACVVGALRKNYLARFVKLPPVLSFALGTMAFEPILDIELFFLYISGILVLYFFIVYPFLRLKIIWGIPRITFKLSR